VISVAAIGLACFWGWFQLYRLQDSSNIMYRVTKVLPLAVAAIDGQDVRFSDYLMQYRSSITVLERQEGKLDDSEDSKRRLNYYKRIALDNSELNAYALKLAKQYGITVDKDRISTVFTEHRMLGGVEVTEADFIRIISDNYGLSKSEYERMFIEMPLIKQEVMIRIDDQAKQLLDELSSKLNRDGSNFDAIAKEYEDKIVLESSGGLVNVTNLDGGRALNASSLENGTVSEHFLSKAGDGYYFVKVLNKKDEKVEYLSIKVSLTELQSRVDKLRSDNKVKEYITILVD
jgi:hypothetical protein